MFDNGGYFFSEKFDALPVVKPNRITGEGRMKLRGRDQTGDLKKKPRRKMAKQSRKRNRNKKL